MQVTQQPSQPEDTGQGQGSQADTGEASQAKPGEQSPSKPASEDKKGGAADTAAEHINTESEEQGPVHPQESADSQPTQPGEITGL